MNLQNQVSRVGLMNKLKNEDVGRSFLEDFRVFVGFYGDLFVAIFFYEGKECCRMEGDNG